MKTTKQQETCLSLSGFLRSGLKDWMTMTKASVFLTEQGIPEAKAMLEAVTPDQKMVMTLVKAKSERSSAQHRLKWCWMKQIADERKDKGKGWDAQQWNDFYKGRFMSDLLIAQDGDYRFYFDGMNGLYSKFSDKLDYFRKVGKPLETSELSLESMTEFMNRIDQHAAQMGISLLTPLDLSWLKDAA